MLPLVDSGPAITASARTGVVVHRTIDAVGETEWNALFPGAAEDWAFYRAVEDAPPEGFTLGALTLRGEGGRLLAAAPCFDLAYRLDTPFQGRLRGWLDKLNERRPGITAVKVAGLGSPLADGLSLGFAPDLDEAQRRTALAALLGGLRAEADRTKARILAVKGLGPAEAATFHPVLAAEGFGRIRSVPIVVLPVPYPDLAAYLASLKRRYRSYFKSKMKTLPQLRIEYVRSAAGLEPQLIALYEATLGQSGVGYADFDRIGPGYFASFLERQGEKAQLMLMWRGGDLVSFHLVHVGEDRLISNKMGMRYPDARQLNLYFINWLKLIEHATARGIREIEMGGTTYAAKLLFGGHIETRWLHFRFRRSVTNALSRPFHGLFDFERNDPELKRIRAGAKADVAGQEAAP